MTDLILDEVAGHHIRLHVADSSMSEGVHAAGPNAEPLADRFENSSANVPVGKWRANSRLEKPTAVTITEKITKHLDRSGVNEHVSLSAARLRLSLDSVPHCTANLNHSVV